MRTARAAHLVMFPAALSFSIPTLAAEMSAHDARATVVGHLFAFACSEGSAGAGRVLEDGSVAGQLRLSGATHARWVTLPPDTLRVRGELVCASLRGIPFEPCFRLLKTSANSFRGSVRGFDFAHCDFVRQTDLPTSPTALTDGSGDTTETARRHFRNRLAKRRP